MEKICGSIGLSLTLVYLAAWTIYCLNPPGGMAAAYGVSAIAASLGIAERRDIMRLFRSPTVRHPLLGFAFLLGWTLLILSMIRVYSGGAWFGDWTEHFQRCLFFLHHFPLSSQIWGDYQLPARPPLMNVLGAFFMGQTSDAFHIFQVVFTFLNLLVFLPCCLLLPALRGRPGPGTMGPRRGPILILTVLFALSPVVMEACTYAWSKAFTAFFVVLGIAFYLAGWRKNDRTRITAAFVFLTAGALAHYSAGPYCVFVGLHYVLRLFWRRPRKYSELAGIVTACALVASSWFVWSVAAYGAKTTFGSNTTVTSSRQRHSNLLKICANLVDSTVPRLLRKPAAIHEWDQPSHAGFLRDNVFLFDQVNAIFALGLVGGPLVLWLLYRAFRRPPEPGPPDAVERRFFCIAMVPFCFVTGIAVVGERDVWGSAHLTLLPLIVLGLTLLAASFPLPRLVVVALLAGCSIDFFIGVLLQARIESLENTPARTVFAVGIREANRVLERVGGNQDSLGVKASANWYIKHQYEISAQLIRELAGHQPTDETSARFAARALPLAKLTMAQDVDFWHGWLARHDNQIRFLGDIAVEQPGVSRNTQTSLLVVLFLILMWCLAREVLWRSS